MRVKLNIELDANCLDAACEGLRALTERLGMGHLDGKGSVTSMLGDEVERVSLEWSQVRTKEQS